MPTIFTDNFNSYNNGDLNGQGGWSGDTNFQVQETTVFEGKAIDGGNQTKVIEKSGNSVNDGRITFYTKNTSFNFSAFCVLCEGDTLKTGIGCRDGDIQIWGTWTVVKANITSAWYCIELEWRSSDHCVRARVDGGIWTDWEAVSSSWTNGLDKVKLQPYVHSHPYWDYIGRNPYVIGYRGPFPTFRKL